MATVPPSRAGLFENGANTFWLGQFDSSDRRPTLPFRKLPESHGSQRSPVPNFQCSFNQTDLRGATNNFGFQKQYPADERIRGVCENLLSAYRASGCLVYLDAASFLIS